MIRIAHESDAISLDPHAHQEAATDSILSNIYEALVTFDREMRLEPALAVAWNSLDEHTWTIQLRKGVRFHDGRTFTASDVKFSIERARDTPTSAFKGAVSSIEAIEIVDASTLKLRTARPEPLLMNRLTSILVVPGPEGPDFVARPVGTGPYKFVRWERGRVLEVEAFSQHWNGRPSVDHVLFIPVEEGPKSIEALKQGQVDILRWVPETLIDELKGVPGVRIASRTGLSSYYLWFNPVQSKGAPRNPYADKRVRQALSLAIDRRELVRRLGGIGVPANQLVQKGVFGYVSSLPELPFDADRARTLLAEAGYARGLEATLTHRPQASLIAVSHSIRDMLGKVAVRVTLEMLDWPVALSRWLGGETPFFLAGWRFDDGDATSFLQDCLFTREPTRHYGSFNPGYSNPELDRLIEENGLIFGDDKRLRQYEKLMRLALEEMPLVPLFHRHNLYGVSDRVQWEPRLDGELLAVEISVK